MHLFVYGTLAPGQPNQHILADLNGAWQPATVNGHLKAEGWGAAIGYPGLVLDQGGETVSGQLFSSAELERFWPELDAFEGEGYQRVQTEVLLTNGETINAYVYAVVVR